MSQIVKFSRKRFLSLCKAVPFFSFFSPYLAFSKQSKSNKPCRRVVTGVNAQGKSIIYW